MHPRIMSRIRALALDTKIEQTAVMLLVLLVVLYLLITGVRASLTLLENDELYTVRVASIPSIAGIWAALKEGSDGNPPLYYIITRFSIRLFGNSSLAVRLPAIFSFLVMEICLFIFVRRCLGA